MGWLPFASDRLGPCAHPRLGESCRSDDQHDPADDLKQPHNIDLAGEKHVADDHDGESRRDRRRCARQQVDHRLQHGLNRACCLRKSWLDRRDSEQHDQRKSKQ